jgi:hypothetical protein
MTTRLIHILVHDATAVALNVFLFNILYQVNANYAIIVAGLYCIKTLASFIYAYEKSKEDEEAIKVFERLMNIEKDKNE